MSVAEDYFLIAHDDHTGIPQLGQGKLGYGLAASMLADLVLGYHINIANGVVTSRGNGVPVDSMDHRTLELIQNEPTLSVRMWLDYLSQEARSQVGDRMMRAGKVRRETTRKMLRRLVVYPPLDVDYGARRSARLVNQLRDARMMPARDVTLVKLLVATELFEHALWWEPEVRRAALPTVDAMLSAPVRELAYHTQTAVGTATLEG